MVRGNEAAIFDKSSLKQTMKIDAITAAEKIFAIEGWTFKEKNEMAKILLLKILMTVLKWFKHCCIEDCY